MSILARSYPSSTKYEIGRMKGLGEDMNADELI